MTKYKINQQGMIPEIKENKMTDINNAKGLNRRVAIIGIVSIGIIGTILGHWEIGLAVATGLTGFLKDED